MNKAEVFRMARMAGIDSVQQYDSDTSPIVLIERFANLVASAEREACAKLCEQYENDMGYGQPQKCADAIRARGQA